MAFYCYGKKDICECDTLCADCQHYDNTGGKKVQTNGDRIRAMSDNELAKFLADRFANESVQRLCEDYTVTATQIEVIRNTLYCCWMDWLKQPAEE
jgi:hypothetical protein